MPLSERDLFIACIIDLLQTICEYIELLKTEKKNLRKNELKQVVQTMKEVVNRADEPMIEEN
jgi:hypothetical protein